MRDLVRYGVPEDQARAWVRQSDPTAPRVCAVWPANADAVRVFMRLTRRAWSRHPMNGRMIALIPSEIRATLELMGIRRRDWPAIDEKLHLLEVEGLVALYER